VNEPEAAVWMGRLVELSRSEGALPDPALIWWKARLLERQAAQARAALPIAIAQWLSLVVAVVTMIVLCAVNWPGIKGMLEPAGFTLWVAVAGGVILMGLALRFVFGE
jgi:amino acid transporter